MRLRKYGLFFLMSLRAWAASASTEQLATVDPAPALPTNLSLHSNILYDLGGYWTLDLDIALANNLTIGPTFFYNKTSGRGTTTVNGRVVASEESSLTDPSIGLRLNWYLNHTRNETSWMVSPYWRVHPENIQGRDGRGRNLSKLLYAHELGVLLTEQRVWKNGLFYTWGGGLGYFPGYTATIENNGVTISNPGPWPIWPYFEISAGYMF